MWLRKTWTRDELRTKPTVTICILIIRIITVHQVAAYTNGNTGRSSRYKLCHHPNTHYFSTNVSTSICRRPQYPVQVPHWLPERYFYSRCKLAAGSQTTFPQVTPWMKIDILIHMSPEFKSEPTYFQNGLTLTADKPLSGAMMVKFTRVYMRNLGICAIYGIRPKLILNLHLMKPCLPITHLTIVLSLRHFAHSRAVFFAKFQNDWTTEKDVMAEHDFARFEFKMSFRRKSYIAQRP